MDLVAITRRMLSVLNSRSEPEFRLAILNRLSSRLGSEPYPSLLKGMILVAESDDEAAKELLADTIAFSIDQMNLPSGSVTSWGASSSDGNVQRQLGPIEYVTAWFSQPTQRRSLSLSGYQQTLASLIELFNCSADARGRYPRWLKNEAEGRQEGTYTKLTRERLATIARSWLNGLSPQAIADAAVAALPDTPSAQPLFLRDL